MKHTIKTNNIFRPLFIIAYITAFISLVNTNNSSSMAFSNALSFLSRRGGTNTAVKNLHTSNKLLNCAKTHHRYRYQPFVRYMVSTKSSLSIPTNISSSPSPSFSTAADNNNNDECALPYETLPYRGAEVKLTKDSTLSSNEFLNRLSSALQYWKRNDYTSAWIHVHASRASLVESLTATHDNDHTDSMIDKNENELAFDLHHVNTTQNTIILKKWLKPHTEDKIPPFATHQVGCAGFVLSDQNEILVIKEWTGPLSNRTPSKQWKLPGGLLDAGESFAEGTCREVMEETGVQCDFENLLAFWHRHGLVFGKSDFYFVCMLRPRHKDIELDPVEVSDAKWMHLNEFLETQDHPLIHHVLRNSFQIKKGDVVGGKDGVRLEPVNVMIEDYVQFPNRSPFPTYTGNSSGVVFED